MKTLGIENRVVKTLGKHFPLPKDKPWKQINIKCFLFSALIKRAPELHLGHISKENYA
jgi:hypothetical protein